MSHLSDFALDRIVERGASDPHLSTCAECRARRDLLLAERTALQPQVDALVARLPAKKRQRRVWPFAALAVPALAALLFLLPKTPEPDDGIRVKGGASMRFVVQRGGEVMSGLTRYKGGDALRFIVTPDASDYFLLVGIESSGKVSVYHPFGGEQSVRLEPGKETILPGSLVLDESPNDEIFLGLFSKDPLTVDAVKGALGGRHDEAAIRSLAISADKRWVVITKEQR